MNDELLLVALIVAIPFVIMGALEAASWRRRRRNRNLAMRSKLSEHGRAQQQRSRR